MRLEQARLGWYTWSRPVYCVLCVASDIRSGTCKSIMKYYDCDRKVVSEQITGCDSLTHNFLFKTRATFNVMAVIE